MLWLTILIQTPDETAARLMDEHRTLTRARIECRLDQSEDDVIVCANRQADRWRVPFITPAAGDPKVIDVHGERARLIAQPNNCAEMRLMAYGCGMFGASASASGRASGSRNHARSRPD
jgi:hypothetical protein